MSPVDATEHKRTENISRNAARSDTPESNESLLESVVALWLVLVSHAEATIDGLRLDIKLAAYSLVALLVAGIVAAVLLIGLWYLGMGLLYVGLLALQVPVFVALLVIVLIQLSLLFFCYRFSKRMRENLNFKAVRAALADSSDPETKK